MAEKDSLEEKLFAGEISSSEELNRRNAEIEREYKGKVHASDCHLFEDEKELYHFLRTYTPFGEETVRATVEHERAHYEAAKALGVQGQYGCWLLRQKENDRLVCFQAFVRFSNTVTLLREVLPTIVLAPEDPSSYDKKQANFCKS